MRKLRLFVSLACMISLLWSCNPQKDKLSLTRGKISDAIEQGYDLMKGPNPELGLRYIDSVFHHGYWTKEDNWDVYHAKASYYTHNVRDFEKRSMFIDSMFYFADKGAKNMRKQYRRTLFLKANLLEEEDEYEEAFKVYYDGRDLSEKSGDWCNFANFCNALANIRYRQKQYAQAIPYLLDAYSKLRSCEDSSFESRFTIPQSILNTTGLCYQKTEQPGQAIEYYKMALQFVEGQKLNYPDKRDFIDISRAVILGNLGGALSSIGDFDGAKQALKQNIKINDRPLFEIEDAQTAKIKLANVYLDLHQLDSTRNLLNDLAADIRSGRGKSLAHTDVKKGWYNLEWKYHEISGNLVKAHSFLTLLHAYTDSLENSQSELKRADMDKIFFNRKKDYELSLLHKDNAIKTISIIALAIVAALCFVVLTIIWYFNRGLKKHVADLIHSQHQTKLAMDALENSHNENTRIIKIIAHDLRNPLAAILSATEILGETLSGEDDLNLLSVIKGSSSNGLLLVNELMFINVTREELNMQRVNLQDLVSQCVQMLAHQATQKEQKIELNSEPADAIGSYEKLWRVISNLISNALKFSPVGKTVRIDIKQLDEQVSISVTDNGIGVPDDLTDRLFDMFTKSRRKGTSGEESFGIGLAISKQIIEAHQGKICFENNPQGGSTFTVYLPSEQNSTPV